MGTLNAHTDPLVVNLERFQGPLDLLLHLIRKQDIDIFDIPIARITEQFLAVIGKLDRGELEQAGDFLEMAATLIRIKAQMLFPRTGGEEDEDPRADLVRRLLEYEHFRDAAVIMERAERDRARFYRKGYVPPRPAPDPAEAPLETSWDEVWSSMLELIARLSEPRPEYRMAEREVKLEDKIAYVLARVEVSARLEFGALVVPWGTRMHAIMSLLACLELARRNSLRLRQKAPFSTLWVYRASAESDAA